MRYFVLALAFAFTGCRAASHRVIAPNEVAVRCSVTVDNCYNEAADACPTGFDVVMAQGSFADNTAFGYRGNMLIRCH